MFQRLRMTSRLVLVFSVPLSLCLLIAAVVVIQQVSSRVVKLGETAAAQAAQSNADLVESWINSRMEVVRTLAETNTFTSGDPEAITALLQHFMRNHSEFEVMFYADSQGEAYYHNLDRRNRADRSYFNEIVIQNSRTSVVSNPTYSGTTGNAITLLVHAVKNDNGRVIGLLAATLTLDTLTQLVDDISSEQAIAWLVDSQGIYVAHPEPSFRMEKNALESTNAEYSAMSRRMISGETGLADIFLDNNRRYLVAYHPVVNTPGWSLAVALPYDHVMATAVSLRNSLLMAFCLILIILVGIVILVAKMIVRLVNTTGSALDRIAAGDGDLTQRLSEERYDEFGDLARSFNHFVSGVHGLVQQVAGAAVQLAAASEQLAVSSREASEQVSQQQHETDQVATAMTQMAASVLEVAGNAAQAATAAEQSSQSVEQGDKVVQRTASEVSILAGEVQKAVDVMQRLQKDAESIGAMLEVIRAIADQTNLLALNAAIEAARAGEHGRGFAVVADEVRALATRTQASTEDIRNIIEKLQAVSQDAVNVMDGSYTKANEVLDWSSQASEMLKQITESIMTINDMNMQIATATEEQSAVAEDVNQSLIRISTGVEQLSTGSAHIAGGSDELARLATELQQRVARFKV